jgi:hypothetical protein
MFFRAATLCVRRLQGDWHLMEEARSLAVQAAADVLPTELAEHVTTEAVASMLFCASFGEPQAWPS